MKRAVFLRSLIMLVVLCMLVLLSCTPSIESEPADTETTPATHNASADSVGPPPLIVDTSAPLLLEEPAEGEDAVVTNTEATAENTACFVCHANYMTELLASRHAGVNIGCVHCHGRSIAHRNDENNTTPPEIMYADEKIDPFCQGCHSTTHDIPPRTIVARWIERCEEQANPSCTGCHKENDVPPAKVVARWKEKGLDKSKTDPDTIVCTDCHGDHRMRVRTVIWDRKSGALLQTNKEN